jgi:hypothetical protein
LEIRTKVQLDGDGASYYSSILCHKNATQYYHSLKINVYCYFLV